MQNLPHCETCPIQALLCLQYLRCQIRPSLYLVRIPLLRIRQCVGEKNYKYFILFLFMHCIWSFFSAWIGYKTLHNYLIRINYWQMEFYIGGQNVKATPFIATQVIHLLSSFYFSLKLYFSLLLSCLQSWEWLWLFSSAITFG